MEALRSGKYFTTREAIRIVLYSLKRQVDDRHYQFRDEELKANACLASLYNGGFFFHLDSGKAAGLSVFAGEPAARHAEPFLNHPPSTRAKPNSSSVKVDVYKIVPEPDNATPR